MACQAVIGIEAAATAQSIVASISPSGDVINDNCPAQLLFWKVVDSTKRSIISARVLISVR